MSRSLSLRRQHVLVGMMIVHRRQVLQDEKQGCTFGSVVPVKRACRERYPVSRLQSHLLSPSKVTPNRKTVRL